MRNLILIAHISLDGFVAGPKGELDDFDASEENLAFVCQLTEGADAALFGRISYQLLNNYWPAAKDRPNATKGEIAYSLWYNKVKKIIISSTMPRMNSNNAVVIGENLVNEIAKIKEQPGGNMLIFGSPSVSQLLMKMSLIDSYWIFVNPIIFGKGIPLFTDSQEKIKLKLVATKEFSNGELGLNYILKK